MTFEALAIDVIEAAEATGVEFVAVGAIAAGAYGLPWGRRHVGHSRSMPSSNVELVEIFDDPFVQSEFARRQKIFVPMLGRATWLPTPGDVVVQKLRWGRSKDLDDARDVLAVQGTESLDMAYIENWCARHGTTDRLKAALAGIPPL